MVFTDNDRKLAFNLSWKLESTDGHIPSLDAAEQDLFRRLMSCSMREVLDLSWASTQFLLYTLLLSLDT